MTRRPVVRENAFTRQVLDVADAYAWPRLLRYHTHDSRRSQEGFPDWIFLRPGRLVALELKGTDTDVTPDQIRWVGALGTVPGVDAAIVRPHELDAVARLLGPQRAVTAEEAKRQAYAEFLAWEPGQ